MGQGNQKLRVVTLNYSGIYVSPFQFYAMDNWQELEQIGILFEENLRQSFNDLKKIHPNMKGEYYIRSKFEWGIEKVDKDKKGERYSPLYVKDCTKNDKLKNFNYPFPGISEQNRLMNQKQFKDMWQKIQDKITYEKPHVKWTLDLCKQFDFLCFRTFVERIFIKCHPQQAKKAKMQSKPLFQQAILQFGNNHLDEGYFVDYYKKFMAKCFQKIDEKSKIQMSMDYLINNSDLDIINLQEVNTVFRKQINKQDKYYVFAPMDERQEDQSVLLIKKTLSFIPVYFRQKYILEKECTNEITNETLQALEKLENNATQNEVDENFKNFTSRKDNLIKKLKGHFKSEVFEQLKKNIQIITKDNYKKSSQHAKVSIFAELSNPLRGEFNKWINDYKPDFIAYWQEKSKNAKDDKEKKQILQTLDDIKQYGLMYWTDGFTLTTFQFTRENLQEHEELTTQPYLVGSFHLSSKKHRNKIQVETLGLLVYELQQRKYRFILGGDYNSHIAIKNKDNAVFLFEFMMNKYSLNSKETKQNVQHLQKKIFIYPKHHALLTTKKKRTILQTQTNKSNLLAEKCIDQIISNVPILYDECYAGQIKGLGSAKNENKFFIPNKEHPYDHFIVEAILDPTAKNIPN